MHDGKALIVVEGYVDVIAMVIAGFEGAVAAMGTALTEEQLGLLWRIADEPILCFDGDKAGRRAAYRAVDLALPKLQAGKSLSFALLPEGQDPDDLIRSGGRGAMDEVLKSARPLAEILWMRETEATAFDTPERRAALEARLSARLPALSATKQCGNITGRISRRACAPCSCRRSSKAVSSAAAALKSKGSRNDWRNNQRKSREPFAPLSPRLGQSQIIRGNKSAMPSREALILLAVIEHPWLLETHPEEFAEIELIHPDADRLRRGDPGNGFRRGSDRRGEIAARPRRKGPGEPDFAGPCRDYPHFGLAGPRRARARPTFRIGGPTSLPCIARRAR